METAGGLYEDGSEAEGPCVFLASFSGDCLRDSCNIIALCNHMWIKAPYNLTMTPAFPSKVYRTWYPVIKLTNALSVSGGLPTTNQLVNSPPLSLVQS